VPPHLARPSAAPSDSPAATEEPESAAPKPPPRSRKLVALLYGVVFCLLLGVAAVTAGAIVVLLQKQRAQAEDDVVEWVPNPANPDERDLATEIRWTSAEKALVRDDARVKITSVEYGTVMARDLKNNPIAAEGDFIKVYFTVENRGKRDLQYTSWFGNRFPEAGEQVVAELVDFDGKSWPQQKFPGLQKIQGHTPQIVLPPGERAGDVLIFAGPPSLVEGGQPLKLLLPAAAMWRKFGPRWQVQSGFYRFEVPASMLGGQSPEDE
jgi:hypothetical protein